MLSEVQAKILSLIARNDGLRYSEAYPGEEIDDDLYNYHLQEMVKKGILEKKDKKYQLTDEGKREIIPFNIRGEYNGQFSFSVILVVMRNNRAETLIHKRVRHPYRGEISNISGKIQKGELVVDAAKRKLKEESGLLADFRHWGDFRQIRKTGEGKLFEDAIFSICVAEEPTGELIASNEFGDNWWDKFDKLFEYLEQDVAIAQVDKEMLKEIQNGKEVGNFIPEEIVTLKSY